MLPRLFLFTLIAFTLEVGVFLFLLPWTALWERNYFLFRFPQLSSWLLNYYLRGGISGLGLVDVGLALWQAAHFRQFLRLWEHEGAAPSPVPPSPSSRHDSPLDTHPAGSRTRGQTA